MDGVSQAAQTSIVDQALLMVRQLASRPPNVFDPSALIGALEHLEDVAVVRHTRCKKVYCRPHKLQKAPSQAKIGGSGDSYPWE